MKNESLIIDLQYLAPVILFTSLNKFSNIVFDQYENYGKMSFRNRCQVAGSEGVINLSVPLLDGRDQRAIMKDVKIAGKERWQDRHWKTIMSCYSRSPWFEYYRDELERLYTKPVNFLLDWNLACFDWICGTLAISPDYRLSESYVKKENVNEMVDWRGQFLPKYGAAVVNPALEIPGHLAGRRIIYRQVFEERIGFLPNLSILDLLFCEGGKRTKELIG